MQILEMIPMCLANSVATISVTTSAAAITMVTQKAQTSATSSNKSGKNSSASTKFWCCHWNKEYKQSLGSVQASFWFHRNWLLFL
jgi:hypothetical protein